MDCGTVIHSIATADGETAAAGTVVVVVVVGGGGGGGGSVSAFGVSGALATKDEVAMVATDGFFVTISGNLSD